MSKRTEIKLKTISIIVAFFFLYFSSLFQRLIVKALRINETTKIKAMVTNNTVVPLSFQNRRRISPFQIVFDGAVETLILCDVAFEQKLDLLVFGPAVVRGNAANFLQHLVRNPKGKAWIILSHFCLRGCQDCKSCFRCEIRHLFLIILIIQYFDKKSKIIFAIFKIFL